MAYIGKQPTVGNFVKLDSITTSATATYNLLNGGVAYSPQSANHCIVSLNGVIQSPTTSFTISGSTIVFASALTATDVIDFILVLGDVLNIGTPSDATVGFSKVTSNLITGATAETSIAGGDSILIYDDSATALRKMTRTNFVSGLSSGFTLGTKVTASGTDVTFTGIPSTARMIVIGTDGLSFTGAGNPDVQLQLGDSGGIETTGYKATAVYLSTNSGEASPGGAGYTDKFVIGYQPDQSSTFHHQIILTCQDTSSNTWNFSNLASAYSAGYIQCGAGVKSLSDTLTQLKLSYSGGQSFDAGTINIMYI